MLRALRQWRNVELRKRAGFAYIDAEPGPGELVEFCSACPQDGFNLRENWQDDPEECVILTPTALALTGFLRYKYSRDICLDGNFSADQTKMKCPDDDVHLTNGDGFMVTESLYQAHLKAAVEIKQVRLLQCQGQLDAEDIIETHLSSIRCHGKFEYVQGASSLHRNWCCCMCAARLLYPSRCREFHKGRKVSKHCSRFNGFVRFLNAL